MWCKTCKLHIDPDLILLSELTGDYYHIITIKHSNMFRNIAHKLSVIGLVKSA